MLLPFRSRTNNKQYKAIIDFKQIHKKCGKVGRETDRWQNLLANLGVVTWKLLYLVL